MFPMVSRFPILGFQLNPNEFPFAYIPSIWVWEGLGQNWVQVSTQQIGCIINTKDVLQIVPPVFNFAPYPDPRFPQVFLGQIPHELYLPSPLSNPSEVFFWWKPPTSQPFPPQKNGEESPIWDGEKAYHSSVGAQPLGLSDPSESLEALPGSRRHRSACTAAAPTRLGTHPAGTAHKPVRRQKAGWCLGKPDPHGSTIFPILPQMAGTRSGTRNL